ncbi:MAG: isoprenylcysteine carboxyl methyltransferase [Desulfuromonas sp.]|nr:MAG: isoprenylcysteine carboxyl methyltransferase [Desulfuromonas sp.]
MFLRALLAFLLLPGLAAFVAPPLLVRLDPWRGVPIAAGWCVIVLGTLLLLWCVRDFYLSGKGTLAPWDPPKKLVVIGLYRLVRNPMYVGVLTLVAGWALLHASPLLTSYTVLLAIGFHLRVIRYEEPWLAEQFGDDWQRYRTHVGRWWPRSSP